jgi:hypothetical protein
MRGKTGRGGSQGEATPFLMPRETQPTGFEAGSSTVGTAKEITDYQECGTARFAREHDRREV